MKSIAITNVSTYDARGGAGIAATRLHLALRAAGSESSHLVRFRTGSDPHTYIGDVADFDFADDAIVARTIQNECINKCRTKISNTLFSLSYPGINITKHPIVTRSNVINLHWVSSFLSIESIGSLLSLGIPIVWTLHDQHAFTGGCHYAAGCLGFTQDCSKCPQLSSDPHGIAGARLRDRINVFSATHRPIIVTPSEWMRQCALRSRVFRNAEIHTIPNSVPIDRFFPGSRKEARRLLGIDDVAPCLLFGAESHEEKRKGFTDLMSAFQMCLADPITATRLKHATILCFGEPCNELSLSGLRTVSLGTIDEKSRLRQAYVAADIFVLPSHEDNLPNTILESLSCGTPILAYKVGGISEAVRNGETGFLVPNEDSEALGKAMMDLLSNPIRLENWSAAARKDAVEKFSPSIQSQRYLELYDDLLSRKRVSRDSYRSEYENGTPYLTFDRAASFDRIFHSVACEAVLPAYLNLVFEHEMSEFDRSARGEQIETLTRMLKESESDRAARGEQIKALTEMLKESEADRAARWIQIETLMKMLKDSEDDLRALFARAAFRWLNRFSNWPEIKRLAERSGISYE